MKSSPPLSLYIFLLLFCCLQSASANNPAYQLRVSNYITGGLTNFNGNAIVLQAYNGLPVDTPTLNSMLAGIAAGTTSDFQIVQLVRVLFFSTGQYDTLILPVIEAVPYWINSGDTTRVFWSENHNAMWMSSDWLLHEKYGKAVDATLHSRLVHYLNLKIQYGYYEFFSSVYNPYCLTGLLNLADFAQDAQIKSLATQAAQKLMSDLLLLTNDKGVFYPTAGRNYDDKYESPYGQNHNDLIWLLTGFGQAPFGCSHAGSFLTTSSISVDTVIASWVPILDTVIRVGHTIDTGLIINDGMITVDKDVFQWSAGEYFHPLVALATYSLLTDSNLWHHPDFAPFLSLSGIPSVEVVPLADSLNCASESSVICDDTIAIYKHNSVTLSSVQDFWPGKLGYQQYPCVANVETTAVYTASGQVLPWAARNADEANDDLPYVKQIRNIALLMYRPEPKPTLVGASYPQVTLHWIDANFTEIRNDSMWLLGRVDNNYVAVLRSCTGYIDTFRACNIPNGQAWVIMVGDSATYGTFSQFQQIIDSSRFVEQWYYDTAAQQEVFYAGITVDGVNINYAWGVDSAMPASIAKLASTSAFNVSPNPANNAINVVLSNRMPNSLLEIYNTNGQLLERVPITNTSTTIPTQNFSDGVYAIKLSTDASAIATKIFVISH